MSFKKRWLKFRNNTRDNILKTVSGESKSSKEVFSQIALRSTGNKDIANERVAEKFRGTEAGKEIIAETKKQELMFYVNKYWKHGLVALAVVAFFGGSIFASKR